MGSMKGLLKAHFSIMKQDAIADHKVICGYARLAGMDIIEPKGGGWKNIEDATALMIKSMNPEFVPKTNRGTSYYLSILKPKL